MFLSDQSEKLCAKNNDVFFYGHPVGDDNFGHTTYKFGTNKQMDDVVEGYMKKFRQDRKYGWSVAQELYQFSKSAKVV